MWCGLPVRNPNGRDVPVRVSHDDFIGMTYVISTLRGAAERSDSIPTYQFPYTLCYTSRHASTFQ